MAASAAVSHPVPAESAWIVGYLRGAGQDAQRQALETYAAWRGREVARWFSDPMPPSTAPERGLTRLWDESTGLDLYAAIAAAGWRRRGGRPPAHTVVFTTTYANLAPGRVSFILDALFANDCGVRYEPLDVRVGDLATVPPTWTSCADKLARQHFAFRRSTSAQEDEDMGPLYRMLCARGLNQV